MLLKNKVVIITGGAGLIGQEFAKSVINQGGIAIIADIDRRRGEKVNNDILEEFNTMNSMFVELDITSEKSVTKCIGLVHEKYNKIDALVNNAYPKNKNYGRHFFDVKYDDFIENVSMNIGGYFLPSQLFAKYFKGQGYGNIINVSSIYGVIAPNFAIYNGTNMTTPVEYAIIKSGLLHLTKYMAKYFKGENIRVNAISPGGILNAQPVEFLKKYNNHCATKGMLERNDLNGVLVFLLSNMSKYINGQNIVIDDGFSL